MDGKFASLSKLFRATIDVADKGFFTSVGVLMLLQILRQRESLLAMFAHMILTVKMDQVVTL